MAMGCGGQVDPSGPDELAVNESLGQATSAISCVDGCACGDIGCCAGDTCYDCSVQAAACNWIRGHLLK
jgi:hypothetical protein